jgi:FKBP-type peptidyl-prolyl cis-trans isomerase FklB
METGEKATVFIPSPYAYGRPGKGNIGPNTPLIFELELIKVNPGPRN